MPGRAGAREPKMCRTVMDETPAQRGSGEDGSQSAASRVPEAFALPQSGDAPGEASALHDASARYRARAYYAVA